MSEIKHIAVIRLSAMGDVAMTVPVILAFSQQYPEVKLTVISRPFFKPLFNGIQNVHFLEFDEFRYKGFLGLLRIYNDLQPFKIDAFVDLHNVLRSKVIRTLFALGGIKTAFTDKARSEKKEIIRSEATVLKPLTPIIERHLQTFEKLGFPIHIEKLSLPKKQIMDTSVMQIVGNKTQKWIGIAPMAQYDSKVYPIDLMQNVIDTLATNKNYKLLLFGGKEDIPLLDTFTNKHQNVINIAGKMTFEHELQLISNLDLMLSMDSGNAHISAMFGIKTITLWGATHPFTGFSPFNQPIDYALTSDRKEFPKIPTSIYGNKKVSGYEDAMRTINPKIVVAKINKVLEE